MKTVHRFKNSIAFLSVLLGTSFVVAPLLDAGRITAQPKPPLENSAPSPNVAQQPLPSIRFPAKTTNITWHEISPGYEIARAQLGFASYLISSELLVVRLDPERYQFSLVRAADYKANSLSVREMTKKHKGLLGINSHFFDPQGNALGLLIRNSKLEHRLQRGGSVLTGIFMLSGSSAEIIHRDQFNESQTPTLALQAGPRLIQQGLKVALKPASTTSRRSGIATTTDGKVLLFATFLRFPGASLEQIQDFLLREELKVKDALNLDGGGSSQFFVASNSASQGDIFISGGDPVPVSLVVTKK